MNEPDTRGASGTLPAAGTQSGLQIWIACALFVLLPALAILAVKYFFNL